MNPYFDETLVLILSASLEDICNRLTTATALRESSSHTFVEGLCHEVCFAANIEGLASQRNLTAPIKENHGQLGRVFLGLDKYAHSLFLPYLTSFEKDSRGSHADALTIQFFTEILEQTHKDLSAAYPALKFSTPSVQHNRLLSLPQTEFRKYRMIFFIKDSSKEQYLGRIYLTLALLKD
ncbi:MAG: hypothetical protein KDK41_15330 [Leptospiraceae bacterium]|nr:hypothetical protein [Leptospiraceae bacterium]